MELDSGRTKSTNAAPRKQRRKASVFPLHAHSAVGCFRELNHKTNLFIETEFLCLFLKNSNERALDSGKREVNFAVRFPGARSWGGLQNKFLWGSREIPVQRTKRQWRRSQHLARFTCQTRPAPKAAADLSRQSDDCYRQV